MKKKMSRFISALLVIAMVCAMVPAVSAAVRNLTITGAPTTMNVGETATLSVNYKANEEDDTTVAWSSSNDAIVSINSANGVVTAVAPGSAVITATVGGQEATCTITVNGSGKPVTGVTLDPVTLTLAVGQTATLTATVAPADAGNKAVTWSTSDSAVVTVSDGTVTAVGAGNATITVTTVDGGYTATCAVTVGKSGVTINPTLVYTKTVTLGTAASALGLPATGEIAVVGGKLTYNITWNPGSYNKDRAGKYTLTGTPSLSAADAAKYTLATTEVTAEITVVDKLTAIIDGPQDLVILKGEKDAAKRTLTASITATPANATKTIEWYKSSTKDGSYTKVSGAASETLTISDVSAVGKTYYYCRVKVAKDGVESDWVTSRIATVEVCDQYQITLSVSKGATRTDAATVGSAPTISAVVKEYKNGEYVTVSGGTIRWEVNKSSLYATLSPKEDTLGNRGTASAALTIKGVDDAANVSKFTVTATVYGSYSQTIDVYVKPGTAQDLAFAMFGNGATFDKTYFLTVVKAATNNLALEYVKFAAPTDGKMYKSSSSNTTISTTDRCYYTPSNNQTALDGIYFVPSTNAKNPSVTYVAYNDDDLVIATGKVLIKGSAGDITYETSTNQTVAFDEDDFQKFFEAAYTKGTLDYVNFDVSYDDNLNTRAYGYLYESADKNADYVDNRTDYCYDATSRQADLDTIVFTAGTRTSKYTITVPFTAYGTERNSTKTVSVNGYVTITVNDGKATTIYSTGTSFKGEIYKAMIPDNYTEREVSGFYVDFGTVTGGKLYYDYKTIADAKEVTTKTMFFFDAGKNELDLEDVYFVPEAGATTAKVAYTIYNGKTKVDTGTITFTVIQQTKSNYFSDVTESNTGKWSANAIDFMSANELVTGTASKTFSPKQTMTRAMLVTILYRVADKPSVKNVSNPFTDVKSGSYYYDAVLWAYKNNIVTGTSASTFNPNGAVTREQIAAILYRYAGSPRVNASLKGYSDQNKVSTYATTAMEWAVKNGIITGKSATTLDPTGKGTRAEVAVMLHRYLTK